MYVASHFLYTFCGAQINLVTTPDRAVVDVMQRAV